MLWADKIYLSGRWNEIIVRKTVLDLTDDKSTQWGKLTLARSPMQEHFKLGE